MLPMIYGGAFSRPGSLFEKIGTVQSRIQDGTRILPFSISNGSRYLLVVGPYNPLDAGTKWFVYDTISRTSTDVTASGDADECCAETMKQILDCVDIATFDPGL